jgi:hypothetical protein
VSAITAVIFMSGVIALLVGSVRAGHAIRSIVTVRADDRRPEPEPGVRDVLPSAAWLAVSLYGLVLASAAMLLTR